VVSRRAAAIGYSPTLATSDLARKLRAEGVDVLDFAAGEPDFPTPDRVKAAGRDAIATDRTRYTANAGIPELRQALARTMARDLGVDYAPEHILVSTGAKASLFLAFQALVDPGDEVVVPAPYWTSYPEQIRLAGGEPVFVPCAEERGFRLRPSDLEAALGPRTKCVVLNYPSNPTGASPARDELAALAAVCERAGVWIVADEIYSRLRFDGGEHVSVAAVSDDARRRTIVIDGASKSFSMTGWRIGWAAGPADVVAAMGKIQSHATSNACSISQWATVDALAMDPDDLAPRVRELERRRDEVVSRLGACPGVRCARPDGAFYAFPNVSSLFGRHRGRSFGTGQDVATFLLEQARVAVVPGEAFGSSEHVRISYAVSFDRVREGLERIEQALAELAVRTG
jgi:aspartate aminotransferase